MSIEYSVPELAELVERYKILSSAILLFAGLFAKHLIVRRVLKVSELKGEDKRHQINTLKNVSNIGLFILMLLLWSTELQQFALSLTAFMVAFVLATREFIQCLLGFVYLVSARPFRIGDWIQIGDTIGEVVETNWLKIVLLEVDEHTYEYTGRHVYIPNNKLIHNTVINQNFMRRYAVHNFTLVTDSDVNVFSLKEDLEQLASQYCSHFNDIAERYKSFIEKRMEIDLNMLEPGVRITTNKFGKFETEVSIFCPTEEAVKIEQQISTGFMQKWHEARNALYASNANSLNRPACQMSMFNQI
ncbi:mechanosensitive ion channel family protein [Alteromonas sp. a30]|uniref:mechanosensitive ion channel family protein n=1 Tax=Alteromonas sp. a30 TaxID=2730917 RepID=UPI0022831D7D|nr:mechanosensitive ion channel family protein [Alteromonas sp. a30]MCY7295241.1 mechanosensitive ion channel family protein [Alteromonas sp. a30]